MMKTMLTLAVLSAALLTVPAAAADPIDDSINAGICAVDYAFDIFYGKSLSDHTNSTVVFVFCSTTGVSLPGGSN